jgi:hypothetical protein
VDGFLSNIGVVLRRYCSILRAASQDRNGVVHIGGDRIFVGSAAQRRPLRAKRLHDPLRCGVLRPILRTRQSRCMPQRRTRAARSLGPSTKTIHKNSLLGQQGVNLIEKIVLGMGFLWYPTGAIEAGIDGTIEIRDAATGAVGNLILQVQSKATQSAFTAETADRFEYLCDARDLEYWLHGNAPVILVVSRPATDEAYWVVIKDYFTDLSRIKARKIFFDKQRDRFDTTCRGALLRIAAPKESGIYLSPPPQTETLYTNLLKVASFAEHIYVAETDYRTIGSVWAALPKPGPGERWGGEWFLKNGRMVSFHDLDAHPWNTICDVGTIECFESREWAYSDDAERTRDFVHLLNRALRDRLWPIIRYSDEFECYYFTATSTLTPRTLAYQSLKNETTRVVFKGYPSKTDPARIAYYRHSAFKGFFQRYDNEWYLEITPTYYYTRNGVDRDGFYEQRIKKIKQLERNPAVLGQLLMWANHLKRSGDLFTAPYPFLQFDALQTFTVDAGVDDDTWLGTEDKEEVQRIQDNPDQLHLFDV